MLLLQFQAGQNRYGIDVREVIEVVPRVRFRELSHADAAVAGVMNYRGTPVPVIDLTALLTGCPSLPFFSTRIIVVTVPEGDGAAKTIGLLAERVTETVACAAEDFQPAGIDVAAAPYLGELSLRAEGAIQRVRVENLLTPVLRAALLPPAGEG